jgi:ribosomal protein S27E
MQGAGTQLSFKELEGKYESRSPEQTVLYQAVAQNFRTFEAMAEIEGKNIPKHVTAEFEAFLKCGILAHGFLRVVCSDCKHEKLLAFSCKKRGFCSSCGGRRMAESAAHLIDEVFPKAGIRQWVLSFPMPVRFILAKNPKVQGKVLTIVHRAITTYIQKKASKNGLRAKLQAGAVTLIQRFGGSLNLNVHYHMLFLEGGFYETHQGPRFWWTPSPTDAEIKEMVVTLASRVIRFLKKKGYF